MKEKYLIVVDVQNDFIDGSLAAHNAKVIVENIIKKVENFKGKIIITMDTHYNDYENTQEGKLLQIKHCIKNTKGWKLYNKLGTISKDKKIKIYEKNYFSSLELAKDLKKNIDKISEIEIIGICTDICVLSNAILLKSFLPEIPIFIDECCCAGTSEENHLSAIKILKGCQILVR